jgi:hypothetical protein
MFYAKLGALSTGRENSYFRARVEEPRDKFSRLRYDLIAIVEHQDRATPTGTCKKSTI